MNRHEKNDDTVMNSDITTDNTPTLEHCHKQCIANKRWNMQISHNKKKKHSKKVTLAGCV